MLITDDTELAGRMSRQSWHGLGSQPWLRHHQAAPQYELGMLGFNYRFDDPRAALVHSRLPDGSTRTTAARRAIDSAYRDSLLRPGALHADGGARRRRALQLLPLHRRARPVRRPRRVPPFPGDRKVQTTVHYPLLHLDGVHAQANTRLPVSEDYARRCVTLPLYPQMEDWQTELVMDAVNQALVKSPTATAAA